MGTLAAFGDSVCAVFDGGTTVALPISGALEELNASPAFFVSGIVGVDTLTGVAPATTGTNADATFALGNSRVVAPTLGGIEVGTRASTGKVDPLFETLFDTALKGEDVVTT